MLIYTHSTSSNNKKGQRLCCGSRRYYYDYDNTVPTGGVTTGVAVSVLAYFSTNY